MRIFLELQNLVIPAAQCARSMMHPLLPNANISMFLLFLLSSRVHMERWCQVVIDVHASFSISQRFFFCSQIALSIHCCTPLHDFSCFLMVFACSRCCSRKKEGLRPQTSSASLHRTCGDTHVWTVCSDVRVLCCDSARCVHKQHTLRCQREDAPQASGCS